MSQQAFRIKDCQISQEIISAVITNQQIHHLCVEANTVIFPNKTQDELLKAIQQNNNIVKVTWITSNAPLIVRLMTLTAMSSHIKDISFMDLSDTQFEELAGDARKAAGVAVELFNNSGGTGDEG